jgi:hypothetical protein
MRFPTNRSEKKGFTTEHTENTDENQRAIEGDSQRADLNWPRETAIVSRIPGRSTLGSDPWVCYKEIRCVNHRFPGNMP